MRRRVLLVAFIGGLLLLTWYALLNPNIERWRMNRVSVVMLGVVGDIQNHVAESGDWPRSWQELYPESAAATPKESHYVEVNWRISAEEVIAFIEGIDAERRYNPDPPGIDLPVLVRYRMNRDESLSDGERFWNWTLAQAIHRDWKAEAPE